jgi:hypothetical protein
MSSEIFYDRAFIQIGEKFIPMCNHGSSNCFEFSSVTGREVPEKHWSVLNYPYPGHFAFSKAEMKHISEVYEKISTDNRGGTRKSRYTSFEPGEFGKWILGGMRNAHTVEEYTAYGNILAVIDYNDKYHHHSVRTTQELMDKLEELKGRSIDISFWDNRQVHRPPLRKKGTPFNFDTLDRYYVLYNERGYFVKRSSRRFWFAQGISDIPANVKKFKSEQDAQKYLEQNKSFFRGYTFEIRCVEKGVA